MTDRTRDLLWADIVEIHRRISTHPFVTGLHDATLERDRFRFYIAQDSHYLRGYARALAACAAKAPDEAELMIFADHATGAIAAEREMHAELLDDLGVDETGADATGASAIAPATQAYVSYLLATAYGGSYAEAVAAVLPCYWIYARVGEQLQAAGSRDPLYQRWIDMYAGEEYQTVVDAALGVADRIGASVSERELELMRSHFHTTARYEWMFWDAAYRMERWPV